MTSENVAFGEQFNFLVMLRSTIPSTSKVVVMMTISTQGRLHFSIFVLNERLFDQELWLTNNYTHREYF